MNKSTKRKLFYIEDSVADKELFLTQLKGIKDINYECNTVSTMTDAFIKLKKESDDIDLVFLDLSLPETQGVRTIAEFRKKYPKMRFVVMTGLDDEDLRKRSKLYGAKGFIVKGLHEPEKMKELIENAINSD